MIRRPPRSTLFPYTTLFRSRFRAAAEKGLLKIISKMGISALSSYCGAQIFEALGDRKSTRLNSSHGYISYAVFCLKKKKKTEEVHYRYIKEGVRCGE